MAIELKVPTVGESVSEVQIGQWLKAEGDTVKKDEPVVVLESEKATLELPAPESGKLVRILHQTGETVGVGTAIAQIERNGSGETPVPPKTENARPPASAPKRDVPKRAPARADKPAPAPQPEPPPDAETRGKVAPSAPAGNKPVETPPPSEPEAVPATNADPPVSGKKVPAGREEEVVPMNLLRRTVARRLVEAQQTMAMVTTFSEVDMGEVQSLRHQHKEEFQKRYGARLGLMSFFVKAAIAALKEFPQVNAEVRGNDIVYRNYFDIGVAIAAPRGLVVPVLKQAERLSFAEVESRIADFAQRAKENRLKPEELAGGTFTITNGGTFGSLLSTPVINPPQAGILGLHSIIDRPVARDSAVVIRPMMYVALTYDHRLVDGREGVLFLRRIKEVIESPSRMLLEI